MSIGSQGNEELIERARRVTAAEGYDIGTRFPSVFAEAEGPWMRDVEGKRLLDVTAASGALLLGNRHPGVVRAITEYISRYGTVFASTLSLPRIELAERLCERYPAAEKVVFTKTGSEATTTAIRLARAATGRDLILTSGYHGWHDWHLGFLNLDYDAGNRVACFGYSEAALERMLTEFAGRVAGVVVTPEPAWFDADYYRRLSALCARHGVLFIIDEVITSFRYGPRGLNGTGEVPADLLTMSKGLANGHSIAAIMGRREVLDAYDAAGIAGTYTREVPPMAAALAVLDELEDGSVHEHCTRLGQTLMDGMRDILAEVGIPAFVGGPPMMFDVVVPSEALSWDIYRAAYDYGAYFEDSGTQMIMASYTESDVDHALTAFEKGARKVAATTSLDPGELGADRMAEFAAEAFGGALTDNERVRARIEETVRKIAAHTAA
ncbi:aminotransferase class III-fold pyridoxal phosphate-dependent enzyme [Amycolatopsis cihanbeyliensis]|uniref:Glutamate-1-semialdehyde 2,1-aminomutase/neamine transaminase/2'-deamino-2'-hydroxyneamine transaminase/neomycin C transaminase n=1 Tax=Amycolatopsis cihanbeyliensis TaxID=1128664 RepID=A0A542DRN1_AMYCI|nr:aminotransferase class III-fold pyridoxal phosphate-dependent enzyme [Amycolatopsis cihanbeyliensis]TQJ05737.1 glutamate-1-semialdehyde 2,1-aminomutase/neamine transaminase/2'-deamino-2'-hydroxyneamine transaminase/neomycin C transaminase [Amycolatopsis cihanbeyliensis]